MWLKKTLFLLLLLSGLTFDVVGQELQKPEQSRDQRQQLLELLAKEQELRIRLEQLEEALKPQNLESSLAGIGSTKPEELREHRRRLLTIEKDAVIAQLKVIAERRSRLESAVADSEAETYVRSAQPSEPIQMTLFQNLQSANRVFATVLALITVTLLIGAVTLFASRSVLDSRQTAFTRVQRLDGFI